MNRAKRDLIETLIVTGVIMAYVLLIFWIRRARIFTAPLVVFSVVTVVLGVGALVLAGKKR